MKRSLKILVATTFSLGVASAAFSAPVSQASANNKITITLSSPNETANSDYWGEVNVLLKNLRSALNKNQGIQAEISVPKALAGQLSSDVSQNNDRWVVRPVSPGSITPSPCPGGDCQNVTDSESAPMRKIGPATDTASNPVPTQGDVVSDEDDNG